jgi:hypothetical protein
MIGSDVTVGVTVGVAKVKVALTAGPFIATCTCCKPKTTATAAPMIPAVPNRLVSNRLRSWGIRSPGYVKAAQRPSGSK